MELHFTTCDKAFNTAEECQLHWVSDDAQDEQHQKTPECYKAFLTRATRATHMRDTRYHNIYDHYDHDFRHQQEVYQFHRNMLAFNMQVRVKAHVMYYDRLLYHYHNDGDWVKNATHGYCGKSQKDYGNVDGLQLHWSESQQHEYCYACKDSFMTRDQLRDHFHEKKDIPGHFWCAQCSKPFSERGAFEKHIIDWSYDHYLCRKCNTVFRSPLDRLNHRKTSHNRAHCASCDRLFENKNFLRLHQLHKHREDPGLNRKKLTCWAANIYYSTKALLDLKPGEEDVGKTILEEISYTSDDDDWDDEVRSSDEDAGDSEYGGDDDSLGVAAGTDSDEGTHSDESKQDDDQQDESNDDSHEVNNAAQAE
ncbi:hypothetical protein ABKA04_002694 [Annulohypoxylon sp. FPYF3050]